MNSFFSIKNLLKFVIFICCIYLIKSKFNYDFKTLFDLFILINLPLYFSSIILISISFIFAILKWELLFGKEFNFLRFKILLLACLKGVFISNCLFGSLFGDLFRVHEQSKGLKLSLNQSLAIAIADRFYTLFFYVIFAFILIILLNRQITQSLDVLYYLSVVIFLMVSSFLFVLILKSFKVYDFYKNMNYHPNANKIFAYACYSFFSSLCIGFSFYLILYSIGSKISINYLGNILAGLLANYFPISFAGWGVREISLSLVLARFSNNNFIINSSILFGLANVIIGLVGGILYFGLKKSLKDI